MGRKLHEETQFWVHCLSWIWMRNMQRVEEHFDRSTDLMEMLNMLMNIK